MKIRILKLMACTSLTILGSFLVPTYASSAEDPKVLIQTELGHIEITLLPDKAPLTVKNFLELVEQNHYDELIFHRVIANFMVQAGGYTSEL